MRIRCSRCGIEKDGSQFYLRRDRALPRIVQPCKACKSAEVKGRYQRRRPALPPGTKRCPSCESVLPLEEFGPNRARSDGRQTYCLTCWPTIAEKYSRSGSDAASPAPAPTGQKFCPRCRMTKPLTEFREDRRMSDGRHSYCRPCHTEYLRLRRGYKNREPLPEGTKRCAWCHEVKPLDEFYKNAAAPGGRRSYCKSCFHNVPSTKRATTRYRKSEKFVLGRREYMREYSRERRRDPWIERRNDIRRITALAVKTGLLEKKPCEVCGSSRSEAHHTDYTKPFDVRWFCAPHHLSHGHNGSFTNPPSPGAEA